MTKESDKLREAVRALQALTQVQNAKAAGIDVPRPSGNGTTAPLQSAASPEEQAEDLATETTMLPVPVVGKWPNGLDKHKRPNNTYANAKAAIEKLGIKCWHDEFRSKHFSEGYNIARLDGPVSDHAVSRMRDSIDKTFRFHPQKETMVEAITNACLTNSRNPIVDWLGSLAWDGTPRLDKMLHTYLGADDTTYIAAVGSKLVCAMVRRAKTPGAKWDHMPIVEGPQGLRKSMWTKDLAIWRDLHTDTSVLVGSTKEQMEIMGGKWVIEVGELTGFRESGRAKLKRFMTADSDTARMAYGRFSIDQLRSSVMIGTSNPEHYLNDPTGERRYWPFVAKQYYREEFLRDRDQLFAEAVVREPAENLWLDTPELEAEHAIVVGERKEPNELVDMLTDLQGEVFEGAFERIGGQPFIGKEERISSADVRHHLGMTNVDVARQHNIGRRIAEAMTLLSWTKSAGKIRCNRSGKTAHGYHRALPAKPAPPKQYELGDQDGEAQS